MKLFFKCTSRSRPHRMKKTIDSIVSNVSSDCDYFIQLSLDEDDPTLAEYFKIISPVHEKIIGTSKNKIDAINRDMDLVDQWWDVLINVSDDQVFIQPNFDLDIVNNMGNDTDMFLHFPDGNRKDLATMSIIGRKYYLRDGYIYHNDYITECCDDEAQEVAKLRGCYKYIDKNIFIHEHPAYNKASWDSNYAVNMVLEKQIKDRLTLERRRKNNFYL